MPLHLERHLSRSREQKKKEERENESERVRRGMSDAPALSGTDMGDRDSLLPCCSGDCSVDGDGGFAWFPAYDRRGACEGGSGGRRRSSGENNEITMDLSQLLTNVLSFPSPVVFSHLRWWDVEGCVYFQGRVDELPKRWWVRERWWGPRRNCSL